MKHPEKSVAVSGQMLASGSGSASMWQVEVIVKHHGVTWASSKDEAIANCNRDGYHGRTDTLKYIARKKPNITLFHPSPEKYK